MSTLAWMVALIGALVLLLAAVMVREARARRVSRPALDLGDLHDVWPADIDRQWDEVQRVLRSAPLPVQPPRERLPLTWRERQALIDQCKQIVEDSR